MTRTLFAIEWNEPPDFDGGDASTLVADLEEYVNRVWCWDAGCAVRLATLADIPADLAAEALGLSADALTRGAIYASNDSIRTSRLVSQGCEDPLTVEWPAYCDADEAAFYAAEELVRAAQEKRGAQ